VGGPTPPLLTDTCRKNQLDPGNNWRGRRPVRSRQALSGAGRRTLAGSQRAEMGGQSCAGVWMTLGMAEEWRGMSLNASS